MIASFFLVSADLIASLIRRFASSSADPSAASADFLRYYTPRKKAMTAPTKKEMMMPMTKGMIPIVLIWEQALLYAIFNVRNPPCKTKKPGRAGIGIRKADRIFIR